MAGLARLTASECRGTPSGGLGPGSSQLKGDVCRTGYSSGLLAAGLALSCVRSVPTTAAERRERRVTERPAPPARERQRARRHGGHRPGTAGHDRDRRSHGRPRAATGAGNDAGTAGTTRRRGHAPAARARPAPARRGTGGTGTIARDDRQPGRQRPPHHHGERPPGSVALVQRLERRQHPAAARHRLPPAPAARTTPSHAVHTTGSGYQFGGVGFDLNNTTTTPESAQSRRTTPARSPASRSGPRAAARCASSSRCVRSSPPTAAGRARPLLERLRRHHADADQQLDADHDHVRGPCSASRAAPAPRSTRPS